MKTLTSHINEALKIGKDISSFSKYSCRPADKKELEKIIEERIKKEGNNCNLNDIDTSLITDMSHLFRNTDFNGDISEWNTSNVTDMSWMFTNSKFNGDISKWDVSSVKNAHLMFYMSKFNGDISDWNTSSMEDMTWMFAATKFTGDISKWIIEDGCDTREMFKGCSIKKAHKPAALQ